MAGSVSEFQQATIRQRTKIVKFFCKNVTENKFIQKIAFGLIHAGNLECYCNFLAGISGNKPGEPEIMSKPALIRSPDRI